MSGTMRKTVSMAVCLGLATLVSVGRAQEGTPKPTAEHERLAHEVGTWDATVKSWMQGPNAEPTESKGVEIVKLMPGGLWAISEFHGKFGDTDFHGHGHSGYDPRKKKYVGTWVDSMSPSMMTMEGDFDPNTKTMTSFSKGEGPDGKPYEAKMTSVHKDKNTRVFTMSMKTDETKGDFVKMMEITYTRRPDEGSSK
jgi:hypothetical protein